MAKQKTQQTSSKKKPGYLSLTPEDEVKLCAQIKVKGEQGKREKQVGWKRAV